MQNWMQQLLSLQQRCSFVLRFVLWLTAASYLPSLRLAKERRVLRCVTLAATKNSPRLESQKWACASKRARRCFWTRAKAEGKGPARRRRVAVS